MNDILFTMAAIDAVLIMGLGVASAAATLFGLRGERVWDRFAPAVFALVTTSIAAGVLLWGANELFGG